MRDALMAAAETATPKADHEQTPALGRD